jgi:hypothetical protein
VIDGIERIELKNSIKIRSLYYLSLLDMAGIESGVMAGDIVSAIGSTSRHSIYTLLKRWCDWKLVRKIETYTPARYKLGSAGRAYLNRLGKWYPIDDKVRLYHHVLLNVRPFLYWQEWGKRYNGMPYVVALKGLKYPYQGADDYVVIRPDINGHFYRSPDHRVPIRKLNVLNIFDCVKDDLFMETGEPLIQKLLDEHIIYRGRS